MFASGWGALPSRIRWSNWVVSPLEFSRLRYAVDDRPPSDRLWLWSRYQLHFLSQHVWSFDLTCLTNVRKMIVPFKRNVSDRIFRNFLVRLNIVGVHHLCETLGRFLLIVLLFLHWFVLIFRCWLFPEFSVCFFAAAGSHRSIFYLANFFDVFWAWWENRENLENRRRARVEQNFFVLLLHIWTRENVKGSSHPCGARKGNGGGFGWNGQHACCGESSVRSSCWGHELLRQRDEKAFHWS